jgi:uncharacterized protein (DUF1697 family)
MRPGMGMTRQVALLRGINVGGHNRLPMARLRELMQSLGHADIRTHLQSGNVVFSTDAAPEQAAAAIEAGIAAQLELSVRVLVRTVEELAAVVEGNPMTGVVTDPARYIVLFLSAAPDPERLRGIDASALEPERFAARGREIYVWCPGGVHASPALQALGDRRLQVTVTARNWNTVTRLLSLAGE